jgi:Tol biopolymer transport system component
MGIVNDKTFIDHSCRPRESSFAQEGKIMNKKSFFALVLVLVFILSVQKMTSTTSTRDLTQEDSISKTQEIAEQHFKKAIDLLKQTNFQAAIAKYKKVIEMLPDSEIALDARYWIGQSYFRMGRHAEALAVFKKLIQDYPESAIAPVTHVMISRVEKDKESAKTRAKMNRNADKKVIIDPGTGAKYKRIGVFTGKKDVIDAPNALQLSSNGKFLLDNEIVIPWEEGEPFDLVEGVYNLRGIWSPDAKKAAFYAEDAIWVVSVSPETGRAIQPAKKLLDGKYKYQSHVSWSPDSEKIAFTRVDEETKGDIWTMSIADRKLTQITDDPLIEARLAWSPDGSIIAYTRIGEKYEIRLIPVEGGKSKKIAEMEYGGVHSWSPDGEWLIYTERLRPYLFHLTDERVVAIDPPDGVGDFFSWSLDGKKLLFYHSSYDWTSTLRVVSTSGGPSFRLARHLELWPYPHFWTAESDAIVCSRAGDAVFVMISLAGEDPTPIELDSSSEDKLDPLSLSPDGKRLLCSIEKDEGNEDLYMVPVSLKESCATGKAVAVFKDWNRRIMRTQSAWAPDSKSIAFIHKGDIWMTSARGEKPVQITKTTGIKYDLVWSPDGEKIAYTEHVEQEKETLMVISVSGGEPMKILGHCGSWRYAWSPSGKNLTVISDGKISNIPVSGGKARMLLDLEKVGFFSARGIRWLPDGKHFAFMGEKTKDEGSKSWLYIVSADGSQITELAADDASWKDEAFISPDGNWISYTTDGFVKMRNQATIWEVKVDELLAEREK